MSGLNDAPQVTIADPVLSVAADEAKSFLLSKTVWTNVLAIPVAFLAARGVPVDADTQAALVTGILALVNIGLRFVTRVPIKLAMPQGQVP